MWIGAELRDNGLEAEVCPAEMVRGVGDYDAVILGGAVYAGRWVRAARRFARRHADALRERPLWMFSSGPLDYSAATGDAPVAPGVRKIIDRLGPRDHATFGGRLERGATGFPASVLAERAGGDYRDFEQVRRWVAQVSHELAIDARSRIAGREDGRR